MRHIQQSFIQKKEVIWDKETLLLHATKHQHSLAQTQLSFTKLSWVLSWVHFPLLAFLKYIIQWCLMTNFHAKVTHNCPAKTVQCTMPQTQQRFSPYKIQSQYRHSMFIYFSQFPCLLRIFFSWTLFFFQRRAKRKEKRGKVKKRKEENPKFSFLLPKLYLQVVLCGSPCITPCPHESTMRS